MQFSIREFVAPEDYQAAVDIQNAVVPMTPAVVEDYADYDRTRDQKYMLLRWLAEVDGQPVGMAQVGQYQWNYDPGRFNMNVRVVPDFRGQGIGTALYDTILTTLEPYDPAELRGGTWEDQTAGVRFLAKRGFEEKMRFSESHLDLPSFDPTPYAGLLEKVAAQGIKITNVTELAGDPDRNRKLWELEMETVRDVPGGEEFQMLTFERWCKDRVQQATFLPEAYVIALAGDEHIGMSCLWSDRASDMLYTGLTSVRREWRRRGIATALKVHALSWGKANGNSIAKTDNEVGNVGMLAINQQLGFVKQPDQIEYVKVIREGVPA